MFEDYCISLKLEGGDLAVVTNGLTELKYIMGIGRYFTMVKKRFGNQIDIGCLCKITDNFIKTLNEDYCCVLDSDNTYNCNRSVLIFHDSIFLFDKNIIARGDFWCSSMETLCAIDDAQETWCRFGHDGIKKNQKGKFLKEFYFFKILLALFSLQSYTHKKTLGGAVMAITIKHPDISVQLVGQDGNIFNLMGIVSRALCENGFGDEVDAFVSEVTSSNSYHEALAIIMQWVDVH